MNVDAVLSYPFADGFSVFVRGGVQRFGDHVDTDAIIPGQFCHLTELKDLGDKVSADERAKVESALGDLKSVLKSDDKDKIEKKLEALSQASSNLLQQAFAAQSAEGAAGAGAAGGDAGGSQAKDDNIVDAEFEEVKDKDKDRKAS